MTGIDRLEFVVQKPSLICELLSVVDDHSDSYFIWLNEVDKAKRNKTYKTNNNKNKCKPTKSICPSSK